MKRIFLSLITIALVSTAAVGATKAYFSSEVASAQNTFATGDMRLLVNEDNPTTEAVYNVTNMAPGQVLDQRTFVVQNTGTINANHLDLTVTLSGNTDLAKYIVFSGNGSNGLRFGNTTAGNQSVRLDVPGWTAGDFEYEVFNGLNGDYLKGPNNADNPKPTDATLNGMDRDKDGKVTLADLAAGKIRITPGTINAGIGAGTTATLWMNAKVDPLMGDTMQGQSVSATFTWTLHQDASQF